MHLPDAYQEGGIVYTFTTAGAPFGAYRKDVAGEYFSHSSHKAFRPQLTEPDTQALALLLAVARGDFGAERPSPQDFESAAQLIGHLTKDLHATAIAFDVEFGTPAGSATGAIELLGENSSYSLEIFWSFD
jgi:hypothetical protein